MAFNSSQTIPKELLKFRLEKQLARLKQILNEPLAKREVEEHVDIEVEVEIDVDMEMDMEEDRFQLYQRILSWFIMGRLAKSEFDGIFEKLLNTSELIEVHNKVIELLRAIYCDSPGSSKSAKALLSSSNVNNLPSGIEQFGANSIETDLLPLEEYGISTNDASTTVVETLETSSQLETAGNEDLLRNFVFEASGRSFDTSIENLGLTASEEALISEAMRNPIHDIATNERGVLVPGINFRKGFDVFDGGSRQCTESHTLPDQTLMKQRLQRVCNEYLLSEEYSGIDNVNISDPIAVLACKALEDYMRNLLENVATLKYGHQSTLRPPISYIFPNCHDDEDAKGDEDDFNHNFMSVHKGDLSVLFKLKPWLLADMEVDIISFESETAETAETTGTTEKVE